MTGIRQEQPQDIEEIREVNVQAFGQSEEADIIDALRRNCSNLLSLVAIKEDHVVGHILFSPATLDEHNKVVNGMALGPMAVRPDLQRQGIGSDLVQTGIKELKNRRCPFVILLGHSQFYPRFGFESASRRGILCEWEAPEEAFMILVLNEPDMDGVTGLARYRPEFKGETKGYE